MGIEIKGELQYHDTRSGTTNVLKMRVKRKEEKR